MKEFLKNTHPLKVGAFVVFALLGIFFGSGGLFAISAAFGLIILFECYVKITIPNTFSIVFVSFIAAALTLGSYFDFYESFWWWDDVLHGLYGIGFAILGYVIIQYLSIKRGVSNDILIICLFSFCFSVAGGAIWEIYEFSYDQLMDANMQRTNIGNGVDDTMHDIILETLAALATNAYIYAHEKLGNKHKIKEMTEEFVDENMEDTKKL